VTVIGRAPGWRTVLGRIVHRRMYWKPGKSGREQGKAGSAMALVLIADDDPAIRDLVVFQLQAEGHRCVAVGDGEAALAAMREHAPDLAILDVSMPGMSGFEVCRELRADPALAWMPVLVLTASVQGSDVTQGFASGADDYVVKPFDPRELSERVRAMLDRAAGFPIF